MRVNAYKTITGGDQRKAATSLHVVFGSGLAPKYPERRGKEKPEIICYFKMISHQSDLNIEKLTENKYRYMFYSFGFVNLFPG